MTAAGVGAAIGGPVGALVGAAVSPAIELILMRERRSLGNMDLFVEMVTEFSGLSAEEFALWAQEREGRFVLVTSALTAVSRS